MKKEILQTGTCGNPENSAHYEIYNSEGITAVRIFGKGGVKSYQPENYRHVDTAPWKEYPIEKAVIEEGITSIGSEAFRGCKALKTVFLPKTLSEYGLSENVFGGCDALCEIHAADIAAYARIGKRRGAPISQSFDLYCRGELVREVEIRNGATPWWGYEPTLYSVFAGCKSIEKITLYSGFAIEKGAFRNCIGLKSVILPRKLKQIEAELFSGCTSLKEIKFTAGIEKIGGYAFSGCSSLESVDIPESVENIEEYAFENCKKLVSISLPQNISEIDETAFSGCENIEKITVQEGEGRYSSVGNCLYDTEGKTVLRGCSDSIIPEDTECIAESAFMGCKELRSVELPGSAVTVGDYAFRDCPSLTKVCFGGCVKEIPRGVFANCVSLTEVCLADDNLPKTESSSFENCPSFQGFRKKDGTLISLSGMLISGFDALCKNGSCSENIRKICALLRSSVNKFRFSRCSSYSLTLQKEGDERTLVFALKTNDGTVWPESSMPYREWDDHKYICTIPADIPDSEAEQYACAHLSEWRHTVETKRESV